MVHPKRLFAILWECMQMPHQTIPVSATTFVFLALFTLLPFLETEQSGTLVGEEKKVPAGLNMEMQKNKSKGKFLCDPNTNIF